MKSTTGIIVAEDGKTIADDPLAYRSDHGHLMIDSRPEAKHLGVFDDVVGGPTWSMNAAQDRTEKYVFFEVKHGLPFIPRVSVYMLIRDAPADIASYIGSYAGGFISIGSGAFGESVYTRVDKEKIQIYRHMYSVNIGQASLTKQSTFQNLKIRAKYMIFSNQVANEPYEISLPFI